MSTVRFEAQVSPEQLLNAIAQLPPPEFERLLAGAVKLRYEHQKARSSARQEKELIAQATVVLPAALLTQYRALRDKQRIGSLKPDEHRQLLALIQDFEERNVKRLSALAELARLREKSLAVVMDELGVKPPEDE